MVVFAFMVFIVLISLRLLKGPAIRGTRFKGDPSIRLGIDRTPKFPKSSNPQVYSPKRGTFRRFK